jgi:hypothetical protein
MDRRWQRFPVRINTSFMNILLSGLRLLGPGVRTDSGRPNESVFSPSAVMRSRTSIKPLDGGTGSISRYGPSPQYSVDSN